jgi:hypothetical protein
MNQSAPNAALYRKYIGIPLQIKQKEIFLRFFCTSVPQNGLKKTLSPIKQRLQALTRSPVKI